MGNIVQSVSSILTRANRAAEGAAQNITNISTPGYRARTRFEGVYDLAERPQAMALDPSPGRLLQTGSTFDVAISGDGFFELGGADGPLYTRNGQFSRDAESRLIGLGGRPVQSTDGSDILVPEGDVTIDSEGVVMLMGEPIARLAVVLADGAPASGPDGLLSFPPEQISPMDTPVVRQGFLESSNVSLGDEMVTLMESIRRAETGQRLMNIYDDLLGRVATTLGQSS